MLRRYKEGKTVGELMRDKLAEQLSKRYPSLPFEEDHSLRGFLDLINVMKAEGQS